MGCPCSQLKPHRTIAKLGVDGTIRQGPPCFINGGRVMAGGRHLKRRGGESECHKAQEEMFV